MARLPSGPPPLRAGRIGAVVRASVPYGVAAGMNTPSPDPGEEFPHVNTQLFGLIAAAGNRGLRADRMTAPFNAPGPGQRPTMDGFITDYIGAFAVEQGRQPGYDEYAQIMTGYTPRADTGQLRAGPRLRDLRSLVLRGTVADVRQPVVLPRGDLVRLRGQPFPGRFLPAAQLRRDNLQRLESRDLTWRVYCDPPSHVSFTGLIHAPRLRDRFDTNFFTADQFLADAANGDLPAYSFIEPNLLYGHNDMHPASDALFPGMQVDPPSSLLGGEALLARIYDAVRCSASARGRVA